MTRRLSAVLPASAPVGVLAGALLLCCAVSAPAQQGGEGYPQRPHADARGDLTVALTGDAIITRELRVYGEPGFRRLRRIIREADLGFTNLEVLFHDYGPEMIPQEESGGTYMRADPELARELAWMGFDVVSRANNHTMDFGPGGMRSTTRAVEEAGLAHAGAGENLAEACEPAYVETAAGRVALISVASTFDDFMRAGAQRMDMRGRPGLCPLRYERTYRVPREDLEELARIRGGLFDWADGEAGDTVDFFDGRFVASGGGYGRSSRVHPGDAARVLARIRDAGRQAKFVLVNSHTHEGGEGEYAPAEFFRDFARRAVEAGADAVVVEGPHVLRGVEIHRGRPIFHSLGNFLFQNETVLRQPTDNYRPYGLPPYTALPGHFQDTRIDESGGGFPADAEYWESAVAEVVFSGGEPAEIRLHPVTLGYGLHRSVRGRPVLAEGDLARRILADLEERSAPFGTDLAVEDGVGVIDLR